MASRAATDDESQPVVLTDVTERIGTITLNRPERRNALNAALIAGLDEAVRKMAADPRVKVVVLTGAAAPGGAGGFCSGGDIKDGAAGPGGERGVPPDASAGDLSRHDLHAAMSLHLMPKPTIAMVGGPAVGAGCSLAAACDLRFASQDATFRAGFTANGLAGDYGGTFFWTRIGGTALARRLYLLDETIPASEALRLGMIHVVLPPDELRSYTHKVARELARVPAPVVALVKENLNQAEDEVERRRWLFANEAENQRSAARATSDRLRRRRPSSASSASPPGGGDAPASP